MVERCIPIPPASCPLGKPQVRTSGARPGLITPWGVTMRHSQPRLLARWSTSLQPPFSRLSTPGPVNRKKCQSACPWPGLAKTCPGPRCIVHPLPRGSPSCQPQVGIPLVDHPGPDKQAHAQTREKVASPILPQCTEESQAPDHYRPLPCSGLAYGWALDTWFSGGLAGLYTRCGIKAYAYRAGPCRVSAIIRSA